MWWLLLLLLFPSALGASCLDSDDPAYDLAISQGNYDQAFKIVAREMRLSAKDEAHFKIVPGFSQSHDDRNGQADPDTEDLRLDPQLFLEDKNGACQGIAHERQHLRQFEHDRHALHAYFSQHPLPSAGWDHCDREHFGTSDPQVVEDDAYACLEDNDLKTHAAAEDIDAVLAQLPYARNATLRDDDLTYLTNNLQMWVDNVGMIQDQSNTSYYLPEIKKWDTRLFCKGVHHLQTRRMNVRDYYQVWQSYCRINGGY
jgi:hypothetical protein